MTIARRVQRVLAGAAAVAGLATGAVLAGTPASAATSLSTDTGVVSNFDGGCTAQTKVTYYPGSDTALMTTTVTSPYLFAACRVNATLWVHTSNNVYRSATQYAMACAVWDGSCASTRTWTNQYLNATPDLRAAYPDATARESAVKSISVTFAKA